MKKLFFILIMSAMAATTMAQSQLSTIRGKDKNGKTIKVEYYQGTVEDYIESVKYQVVDELQTKAKDLQSKLEKANKEIETLKKQASNSNNNNNADLKNLQNQLAKKEADVKSLNAQLKNLNDDIASLDGQVEALGDQVTALRSENQNLQTTIQNLQKGQQSSVNKQTGYVVENQQLRDTIAKRDKAIKERELEIKNMESQLASANTRLNQQIKECERQIAAIQNDVHGLGKPLPTATISLSAGIGPVFVSNAKLGELWSKDVATAKYFNLNYATARLTDAFPISIEVGLGIESYKMGAHINACQVSVERQVDLDGDAYTAIYDFSNISETASLTYLNVPISICLGQPAKDRVTAYFKLGLTPSVNIGKKFDGVGTYSLKGYYPQWDVTLEDVEPLGFGSNKDFYEDAGLNPSKFVLVGHAAFGTYVPLSSKLLLKAGMKCEYTFMQVAPELNGSLPFAVGQSNLVAGAKMFVPSLELGLVYTLK